MLGAASKMEPFEPVSLDIALSNVHGLGDLVSLPPGFRLNFPGFLHRFGGLELLAFLANGDLRQGRNTRDL